MIVDLDVGCGWNYRGDVNVDLFLHKEIANRREEQQRYKNHKSYDKRRIPNLVCADCHHLPFREDTFNIVYCSHLLEHKGIDADQTIKELLRVANGKLEIRVPSPLANSAYAELHDKVFQPQTFHHIFKGFKRKVRLTRFMWKHAALPKLGWRKWTLRHVVYHLPKNMPCPIPTEIICEVWKNVI